MLYWLTGTAGSAARLYYENAPASRPTEPTTAPLGLAAFAGDFSGIRRFASATTATSSAGRCSTVAAIRGAQGATWDGTAGFSAAAA